MKNLIAETSLRVSDIPRANLDPAFRRATDSMILTATVGRTLLDQIPQAKPGEVSLIVGTHFGEVHSSLEFLRNLYSAQTASPTHFQNSLHNSTLGFTAIQLKLTGPALTVSADKLTAPAAQETALQMLELTPYALLCLVDVIPDAFKNHYLNNFPFMQNQLDRACGFLFASDAVIWSQNLREIPCSF